MSKQFPGTSGKKIEIVIFSPQVLELDSLQAVFEKEDSLRVVGRAGEIKDLYKILKEHSPGVVLLCLSGEHADSLENIKGLRDSFPKSQLLILFSSEDLTLQSRAVLDGAAGIIQKKQNTVIMLRAIKQIYEGGTWVDQKLISRLLDNGAVKKQKSLTEEEIKLESLTKRELEVIKILCEGLENKKISKRLFISVATVRHHLSSIYSKLHVEDRLNLIIYAYRNGLAKTGQESAGSSHTNPAEKENPVAANIKNGCQSGKLNEVRTYINEMPSRSAEPAI